MRKAGGQNQSNGWNGERVAFITAQFLGRGRSAGQIALLLGDVSREAVCGKLYRLGVRRPAVRRPRIVETPGKPAKQLARKEAPVQFRRSFCPRGPSPELTEITTEIALLAASDRHCRWVAGKMADGWYVCGKPKPPARSFCADHAARVYRRQKRASGKE